MSFKKIYMTMAGLFGCFALILQLYLIIKNTPASGKSYLSETVRFFSYMTIWTNILVTLTFLIPVIAKKSRLGKFLSSSFMETGTMLYITIVGLAYHFLLANVWDPKGWQKVADVSLHYVVPIIYIIYWFLFVNKGTQQYSNAYKWLAYPLIYIIYALTYGAISKFYTYPFIDVQQHGYEIVLRNSLFLALGYYLMGLLLIFIDKQMGRPALN
jgi:hypothetical protein